MKFEGEVTVVGATSIDQTFEGKKFDDTKVFIQAPIDEGRGSGSTSIPYKWGDHNNYDKVKHLLPHVHSHFKAKAVFQTVTSGTKSRTEIVDLVPLKDTPVKA